MADPSHPEHAAITEGLDGYDPKLIDLLPIRIGRDRMATRRDAARKLVAKKRRRDRVAQDRPNRLRS
jgi:hypothetical protein